MFLLFVQNESAWVLCNVAAGCPSHTQAVLDAGALHALVRLLASHSASVRLSAVWAIVNISGSSPTARNLVLAHSTLTHLLQ